MEEFEIKFPAAVGPPPARGWRIWDRVVDGGALVLMIFLLLPAIIFRLFSRMGQRFRIVRMDDEYEQQKYRLVLGASRATDVMKLHFSQLQEMEECYLTTPWNSLEEARTAYQLLQAARTTLLMEALNQSYQPSFPGGGSSGNS